MFVLYLVLEFVIAKDNKRKNHAGGNSGLGYESAKYLALRGADIIIASRNLAKESLSSLYTRKDWAADFCKKNQR